MVVRVPSSANSVLVIGVRIHALLAGEAKANALAVFESVAERTRAQAQQCCCKQVGDFLLRVSRPIRRRGEGDGFEFCHGKRLDGKRCPCYEPKALRVTCFSGRARAGGIQSVWQSLFADEFAFFVQDVRRHTEVKSWPGLVVDDLQVPATVVNKVVCHTVARIE